MRLDSGAPVFTVSDVGATMQWYETVLGFRTWPFPKSGPPYVFCSMNRDGVEIMLQRLEGYEKPDLYGTRPGGVWDVYIRMDGVRELYDATVRRGDVVILEHLSRQPYGDSEFVIKDPNGYTLVFSELIPE